MDCRLTLLAAFGLACGTCGCQSPMGLLGKSEAGKDGLPGMFSDGFPSKGQLKASTCVTFGNLREQTAAEPGRSRTEREALLEHARQAYQKAIDTDPNYLPAYLALARHYEINRDRERALATYEKALKVAPKNASLHYDLGMHHARLKEWEPALASMRKATELEPDNRVYLKGLGLCLARAGKPEDSLACLKKAMPEAEAYLTLGRMLHHLKQADQARQCALKALELDPQLELAQQLLDEWNTKAASAAPAAATESDLLSIAAPAGEPPN